MPAKIHNTKYSMYHVCPECGNEWKSKRNSRCAVNHFCLEHRHLYIHKNRGRKVTEKVKQEMSKRMKLKFQNEKINHIGPNAPSWKGGISNNRRMVRNHTHPYADCGGRVTQYRLIVEKALGRYLKTDKDEVVHHINGDSLYDANDNLLVCTRAYHTSLHYKMRGNSNSC